MKDPTVIAALITALLSGGAIQALFVWLKDRKKDLSTAGKTDAETKLAYYDGVIQRLEEENKRILANERRNAEELALEQERSAKLRGRVRQLEDELDGVRNSARETERKCTELSQKLRELVEDDHGGITAH